MNSNIIKQSNLTLSLVLLGAKSSGKTIYLSTLWGEGLLTSVDNDTTIYLKNTWNYIQKNKKAEATSKGKPEKLSFGYKQNEKIGRVNFFIKDYDGNFTETISKTDDNAQDNKKELLESVKISQGCIFFFPYEDEQDRFQNFAQELDAFINEAQFNSCNKSPIPANIVITKWDESEYFNHADEIEKAEVYIKNNEHLKRAAKLIKDNFENTKITPISSFGNYNLLNPINFSFETTFKQWYNTAENYKKNKENKKLITYLSKRYEHTKFTKIFDFNKLYNEAQEVFIEDVKNELNKKETLEDKEKYFGKIKIYYKTKPELLKPIEEALNQQRKKVNNRRFRNKFLIMFTILCIVFVISIIIKTIKIDELYNKIVMQYEKKTSYKVMKKNIDFFLRTYQKDDIFCSASNISQKRVKISEINIELFNKYEKIKEKREKEIFEEQIQVMNNPKFTPDEKSIKLNQLSVGIKISDSLKEKIEANKAILIKEKETNQWKSNANDCLKSCITEDSIDDIIAILSTNNNIIQNKNIDELKKSLLKKKFEIQQKISINKIMIEIEDIDSIDEMVDYLNTMADNLFVSSVKEKFIFQLKSIYQYSTPRWNQLISNLNKINKRTNFKNNIDSDVRRFIQLKDDFSKLKDEINKTIRYVDLSNLDYSFYNDFEVSERNNVVSLLNSKMNSVLSDKMEEQPNIDKLDATKSWIKEIDKILNFEISSIVYQYKILPTQETQIQNIKKEYEQISDLQLNGVKNIAVTIKGFEDNSIGFSCGTKYRPYWNDIVIENFSNTLTYKKASECQDNTITFKDTIIIKDIPYRITIRKEEPLNNQEEDLFVSFNLDEIISLEKGDSINKSLDDDKLQLTFRKSY